MTGPAGDAWDIAEIIGRFQNASNATLLAVTGAGRMVVYKPEQGQRPLYDFDCRTLPAREVLTFELARAAGLDCVPQTVPVRGPFGPGSAQVFVEVAEEFDPAPLINEADPILWPIITLDLVINNADRKAGHVIADGSGRIWCIDHGLTLHAEPKLRTVMWGFSGQSLPQAMVDCVRRLERAIGNRLHARTEELIGGEEADALAARVEALLRDPTHPHPPTDRHPLPWPLW